MYKKHYEINHTGLPLTPFTASVARAELWVQRTGQPALLLQLGAAKESGFPKDTYCWSLFERTVTVIVTALYHVLLDK